ncbi:amidophosphoribosyltransferase [Caminicella sporogenes DSM 14501]|uniref:Amidophosphoribosyltransferase n=1 Tax=Caminicella sporogenes DSM 14501 TaxID=1121266 RepID=A0A1M6RT12_9FIRM|nr:amidophosphoribosyltransferase [Caminicella sporogenes]RKD23655.1 amidophosphoribosyltransferase [Caminicella sporogenes]WIF93997.1 amidophosphoribosyltransferase [Caminicella sporogenes]SHK35599.1 amidophosphoribosyltransferase [Caminicella sporogenes DSM 14501]
MFDRYLNDDKLNEECGVFGIYLKKCSEISRLVYFGLVTLQHRGQESAGIAVYKDGKIQYYKDMGLVREVFNDNILKRLDGDIAIGHVRYSTTGESYISNAQPLVVHYKGGAIALAHNGNLVNADKIRSKLEDNGCIFQTSIDSEVIANLIAKYYKLGYKEAIIRASKEIKGAFALAIICEGKLIGVRDPNGLRPLCIGKLGDGYILASESCALHVVGAEYIRDVKPGEIVIIDDNGIQSVIYDEFSKRALCSFEFVYFARPDSVLDGQSVYKSRIEAGRILAREHPVDADIVMSVPDSGTVAAIGYAEESKIPFREGLLKNKYLGRTFIQPDQKIRELMVKLKLSVLRENVEGKRLVLIDDSIVRGTTSKRIIDMLRRAGAKQVHVRVSSPPVKYSCYFGIDTPTRKQLIGATHSVEEIRKAIGADSLGYLSVEGLLKSINMTSEKLCTACFSGNYPMKVPESGNKYLFEKR